MDEELACGGMGKRVEKTRQAMRLPVPPDGMGHTWHVQARGMGVGAAQVFVMGEGVDVVYVYLHTGGPQTASPIGLPDASV